VTGDERRAALDGRRIGPHVALGKGMVRAADRAAEIGAATVQVFADSPTAWHRRAAPPDELPAFRERLGQHDIAPTAIHAAYLINLAGPEPDLWQRSIDVLVAELRMAMAYGATTVNVHVGSHKGSGPQAGVRRIADGIRAAFLAADLPGGGGPRLVLENSAGGGDALGSTIEELGEILEEVARTGIDASRLAFCLDTAHLWGAGVDLRRPEAVDALLRKLDALVGPERLAMVHLNDSKARLGSRADRHQHLGAGQIGEDAFQHLLGLPRLADVPMYLETPGMDEGYDAVNMERVRLLLAGERLPPLSSEALDMRGHRARTEHVSVETGPAGAS
jgi:deoxyribonuclease IV